MWHVFEIAAGNYRLLVNIEPYKLVALLFIN